MNNSIFRILLLLNFILMYKSYTAQQYSFYTLNEELGLSKNSVLGINQLSNGKIYIGTSFGGIDVLNGKEIDNISKNDGLVDNVVYDIINLNNDCQLVTTNKGVSILNNEHIFNLPFRDSLSSKRVYTGVEYNGSLLLGSGRGLAKIANDTIVEIKTNDSILNSAAIIHVNLDQDNNIWCSTMGEGVYKVNLVTNSIKHYRFTDKLDFTFQTFQYSENVIWFLTWRGVFKLENERIERVELNSLVGLTNVYYHSVIRDSKGNIWIATLKGVLKIDKNGIETLFTKKNGLASNQVWKVFEDNEQNIWVLFKNSGISKLTTEGFQIFDETNGLTETNIKSINIDLDNNKWLGTKGGVFCVRKDSIQHIEFDNKKFQEIKGVIQTKEGVFMLSSKGVSIFHKNRHQYIYKHDSLDIKGACIVKDNQRVFVGGLVQGVFEYKNNQINSINDSIGLPEVGVSSIIKTKDNIWWYATEVGLYFHDGDSLYVASESLGLNKVKTISLTTDKEGRLWVGNSEGIFYQEDEKFKAVYYGDSINNNFTNALCFDLEGNLWASKIDGLDKVTIEGGEVIDLRHYDATKGFGIGSLFDNSMALDSITGHVLVGTDKGLLEINPYLDFPNTVESKTQIEGIRLFSQPTDWSIYADSLDENGFPIGLELDYNQNYFTFNYIGICHTYPEGVRYKTKLEGLDKDWVDQEEKRFAIYGNLNPGKYTFLLKSCNNEGIWNKEPIRFSFVIRPPFWQTWWFYTFCFGLFLTAVYSYLKIRNANIQITQKNEQITLKNNEIEQKSNEIMDSINYAKRIQDAMLPDSKLKYLIPHSFVFFQPKDIVSGDFYWLKRVDDEFLLAAVDCTGHGVPGAFVSMIGFSGLDRAVNEYKLTQPSKILEKLSEFVIDSFAKHQSKSINDGMDASLCSLNTKTNVLQYSGANNSIYIIRDSEHPIVDTKGEIVLVKKIAILNEIKATRRPIGKSDNPISFKNHEIQLEKGDTLYLFTDGFPDQFGGNKGKKYMYKTFKRFLISIQNLPIEQQGTRLKLEYDNWAADNEQVDDICIIGIQV